MKRFVAVLGIATFAISGGPSVAQGQEQTWDVDTVLETDLTSSFVFQDSALLDRAKKMTCPRRLTKIVAVNLPAEACMAVVTHAQQHGCAAEESPVVFMCGKQ
jgi:hypothetical protein